MPNASNTHIIECGIIPTAILIVDASKETTQLTINVSIHCTNIVGLAKACNICKSLEIRFSKMISQKIFYNYDMLER